MLASLLTNEVFAVLPARRPPSWRKTGVYNGKYIMVSGQMYDLDEDKPSRKLAKRVVKALRKVKTTPQEAQRVERLAPLLFEYDDYTTSKLAQAKQLRAYAEAVEMLKTVIAREEEVEFLALMMELS